VEALDQVWLIVYSFNQVLKSGVAKYLIQVPKGKSTTQIINELCFWPQGFLFSEFIELYQSLFDSAEKHIAVVRALAKKRKGVSLEELSSMTGMSCSGRTTEVLEELEESGFIMRMPAFGKEMKDRSIRLVDEYTFFYLSWIEEVKPSLLRSTSSSIHYWQGVYKTPVWYEWSGHAFETICFKHIRNIKKALGIAAVRTEESHWRAPRRSSETGAEIDLVIDRADDCIHLCEIKFCDQEFILDGEYAKRLETKKEVFQRVTKTRKTIFLTMITPFGVKKNEYCTSLIDQQLVLDDLF